MSEPIKVGDLVVVVRWPCCGYELGRIRAVEVITQSLVDGRCIHCDTLSIMKGPFLVAICSGNKYAPLSWLRRIPPLEELDETKHRESIEA